jgi:hypothetical protein
LEMLLVAEPLAVPLVVAPEQQQAVA